MVKEVPNSLCLSYSDALVSMTHGHFMVQIVLPGMISAQDLEKFKPTHLLIRHPIAKSMLDVIEACKENEGFSK